MIDLQRSRAGGQGALNAVFGEAEKWGKGRSFVEQDKASAVQCRRSAVFSNIPNGLSPTSEHPERPTVQYGENRLGAGRSKAAF